MRSGKLFKIIVVVGVLGILASGYWYWWLTRPYPPLLASLISRSGVEAIISAHHVRAVRLIDEDHARPHGPQRRVQGPILTTDQLAELRELILNDNHYVWEDAKPCIFHPDVELIFENRRGTPLQTVTLCLTCLEWTFATGGNEDFDPVAPQLQSMINALFPDHPVRIHGRGH